MKIEYPKVIYNKNGAATTVNTLEEHEPLKAHFDAEYCAGMEVVEMSYFEALNLLGGSTETEQEAAVRREQEEIQRKKKEAIKLGQAKEELRAEDIKATLKAYKPLAKNLSSYGWIELIELAKELNTKTGVKIPLRAKRDIVEQAIKEVLRDDNGK